MKYHWIGLTIVSTSLLLAGCETYDGRPDRTATGALTGGALGAATGAIIGNYAGHNTAAGAAIGGALGAVTGGIIGHSMDEQQREMLAQQNPQTLQRVDQGQPLGLADIKALARAGVSDEVILSQIRNSHTVYRLSTAEIIDLKDSGVSEKVIDFMINTPNLVGAAPPPPASETVVVAEPPPPPIVEEYYPAPGPDFIWISGCWGWGGGRWAWRRGYWARPPHRDAHWERERWERGRGGYVRMGGYWR